MTLPPSLADLEPDAGSEPELSRVTLLVGGMQLDVGMPANVGIAAFIDDVIDIANKQLQVQYSGTGSDPGDTAFDNTEGRWSLAKLGSPPVDLAKSLSESDIYDGDVLVLREIAESAAPLLFDDVEALDGTGRPGAAEATLWERNHRYFTYFGVGLTASLSAALLLHRYSGNMIAGLATVLCGWALLVAASVLAHRKVDPRVAVGLSVVATPLIFAGALYLIPDGFGAMSLPMACALTALASLLALQISRQGRTFHTFVIALSVLAGTAALANVLLSPPPRAIGAVLATVSVLAVYLSPRMTIVLSKLPIPRVPTAGEPLDNIETQGGTTVEGVNAIGKQIIPTEEGMVVRVTRANQYLSGILAAAALTAAVGSYLTVDVSNGFFWQGTVFAIAVATVLCLRGRSHHNLTQSATLIGSGLFIGLAVMVKTATYLPGWEATALLGLVIVAVLAVACGVVAPLLEFSPVMRRWVELLEYLAIALVFPLCFWIVRLYSFARDMRI
ncbi:MAG: type VII secretion integral membrane protein EccD [Mycobacterium sp.]